MLYFHLTDSSYLGRHLLSKWSDGVCGGTLGLIGTLQTMNLVFCLTHCFYYVQ